MNKEELQKEIEGLLFGRDSSDLSRGDFKELLQDLLGQIEDQLSAMDDEENNFNSEEE